MRKTIAMAAVAALAATAHIPAVSAAAPNAIASASRALEIDTGVEKVQRRIVRRGGRYYGGRGIGGRGYAPYYGYPYYGYRGHGAGAAVAAGIIGLTAGLALGAAANDPYYGSSYYGSRTRQPSRSLAPQTPSGCYVGAGDRLECPRY